MNRMMMPAVLILSFGAARAAAAAGGCATVVQGSVTAIDPVNKRVTEQAFGKPAQVIATSNATTIDLMPGAQRVQFSAITVGQGFRACLDDRGFATSISVMNVATPKPAAGNPCQTIVQGEVTAIDPVNKRVTEKAFNKPAQVIATSNATTIDLMPGAQRVQFGAIAVGQGFRACLDTQGFATSISVMNIPKPSSTSTASACAKLYQGQITALDPVNKRITEKSFDQPAETIPTSNATTYDQMPGETRVQFAALAVGQGIRICTDTQGFATSISFMNPVK